MKEKTFSYEWQDMEKEQPPKGVKVILFNPSCGMGIGELENPLGRWPENITPDTYANGDYSKFSGTLVHTHWAYCPPAPIDNWKPIELRKFIDGRYVK